MRGLGILLLLAGMALAYLSYIDRMSPLAISVVEQDQRFGLPLASVGGIGILLLVGSFLRQGPAPLSRPHPRSRLAPTPLGNDWKAEVHARAAALKLEPGAHIAHDSTGVVLSLVLSRMPPERVRRAIDSFCAFLAGIPAPPRVRIRFIDCPDAGIPRQHLVSGIARPHLAESFSVLAHEDSVDIRFLQPDPRW